VLDELPDATTRVPENSWAPVDLAPIVAGIQAGEIVGPVPKLMTRTDGAHLLYPGEVHSLAGEPETGKGWIALATAAVLVANDKPVLYLDFEDAPASIVSRLLALDSPPEAIINHFAYLRPSDPFTGATLDALLTGRAYELAVIDGVSEAYALLGLDPYSNIDAAKFLAALARPIGETGAAVLLIDHVVKAKETRGRYALGAQHKLAGIAVAYSTDSIRPPSRTNAGVIKLKVEKDRHGHVRSHSQAGVIALAHITPEDNGEHVAVTLEPPDTTFTTEDEWRPTNLMEKVSKLVESDPGIGVRAIRTAIDSKAVHVDQAIKVLLDEDYLKQEEDGQKKRHFSVTEYRETTDRVPVSQPCPNRVPDTGETDRVPVSPPVRDTDTGHTPDSTHVEPLDADTELARLQAKFPNLEPPAA
jgi:AAA domain